jgi:DNA-binding IclR family transcriptional regulator
VGATADPDATARPPAAHRTGVAQRLLAVLAAFDAEHRELSLTALARRAGLPPATAHRLIGQLTAWGALEQSESGGYRIGLRLWEVATLAPRSSGLRRAALPFMEDLYETTHENVQLAVRDGHDTLYMPAAANLAALVPAVRMAALGASRAFGFPSGGARAGVPFHSAEGPLAAGY